MSATPLSPSSSKEDLEAGRDAGPSGSPPEEGHYWEHDVFGSGGVPAGARPHLKYRGLLPGCGADGRPLLLATVKGVDGGGRPFRWLARRRRKRVAQCPRDAGITGTAAVPAIDWWGWLDAARCCRRLGWWVALGYTLGSVLFVVSGAAAEVYSVANPPPTPGLGSLSAGLVGWPNAVAANLFFFPAGILQLIESTTMSLGARRRAWLKAGGRGPRPGWQLLPCWHDLQTLSWWGAIIQLSGMLGFNMATLATLLTSVIDIAPTPSKWLINFGFTYGGAGFTVSAFLFCLEGTGSWWRGLVPSRLKDLRSISWHAVFWNFHGSVGFLIGGAATYAYSFSWTQLQWINGYGNLGGAVWFLLASLAALVEQVNPDHP